MVTDKMVEAAAKAMFEHGDHGAWGDRDTEFWKGYARAAIEAALSASDAEPVAWESTTVGYTKYVTDARYQKFSDAAKKWYKPYRCSSCADPPAVAVKALAPADVYKVLRSWLTSGSLNEDHLATISREISALVSPADTSPVIPEGWQLVPKVATAEMEDAAKRFVRPYHDIQPSDWTSMVPKDFFRLAWKAMLASAPKEASHDD